MTRFELLVGLVSLLPAAVNAQPAHARALVASLCTGDGVVRTVQLPLGAAGPASGGIPGQDQPGCCAKGCHSGQSRRRGRKVDPPQ